MATERPQGSVTRSAGAERESGAWLPASIAVVALVALAVVGYRRWSAVPDAVEPTLPRVAFVASPSPGPRPGAPPSRRADGERATSAPEGLAGSDGVRRAPPTRYHAPAGGVAEICRVPWTEMHGRGVRTRVAVVASPLHVAVGADDGAAVDRLLAGGLSIEQPNARGETPLMLAARAGSRAMLERLLELGADVDARDDLNRTALMHAAAELRDEHVALLMRAGADGRARGLWDERGGSMTPLDAAWVRRGRPTVRLIQGEILRSLQSLEGPELVAVDAAGNTALHWVARYSGTNMVRLLIERGADLEMRNCPSRPGDEHGPHRDDPRGATALLVAVAAGATEVAEVLLDAGADARAVDERGRGVFHLMRHERSFALMDRLLAAGADVESKDSEGKQPAEVLVALGLRPAFVEALEARGRSVAGPQATSEDLFGLIERLGAEDPSAPGRGDPAAVVALLARNSLLTTEVDDRGRTALAVAAARGLPAVVRALAARGADVDARDPTGRTALHEALDPRTIAALAELGARLDSRDVRGQTPLHRLAREGSPAAVRALLEAGARTSLADAAGRRPLELAREAGNQAVVAILEGSTLPGGGR